jgi:hypothetical protein
MAKYKVAVLFAIPLVVAAPCFAQQSSGGEAGPCEEVFWSRLGYQYDAMRVCRVASSLVGGLSRQSNHPVTADKAQELADEAFRICWGHDPTISESCAAPGAWATPRSWVPPLPSNSPIPVYITLPAAGWLQSDDAVACVLGHEMGHATDRLQNVGKNTEWNEERADAFGVTYVMLAGYEARACGLALQLITGERGQGAVRDLSGMIQQGADRLLNPAEPHPLNAQRMQLMKGVFSRVCARYGDEPIGCKEGWR